MKVRVSHNGRSEHEVVVVVVRLEVVVVVIMNEVVI